MEEGKNVNKTVRQFSYQFGSHTLHVILLCYIHVDSSFSIPMQKNPVDAGLVSEFSSFPYNGQFNLEDNITFRLTLLTYSGPS